MEFTDRYLGAAGQCPKRCNISLHQWHEETGKHLCLVPESEVYKPIKLMVDITKNCHPTEIDVTPWRKDWYSLARNGIAAMMGIPDPKNVELVDDFEIPISNWNMDKLMSYSDTVRVLYGERLLKLKNPPKQIDISIDPQREAIFHQWWENTREEIENKIAKKLKGTQDQQALTKLCGYDGVIEESIRSVLHDTIDTKFIEDHSANSVAKVRSPEQVMKDISGTLLTALRVRIRHSAVTVEGCLANYIGESILENRKVEPIRNEFMEYKSIAHHAMRYPMGNDLLIIIRNGKDKKKGKLQGKRRKGEKKVTIHNVTKTTRYDPHAYHHPLRDSPSWWYGTSMYPDNHRHKHYYSHGHGNATTMSNNKTVIRLNSKPYKGNHKKTVEAYHSLAGRPPVPTKEFMGKTLPGTSFEEEEKKKIPVVEVVDKKVNSAKRKDKQEKKSPILVKSSYTERDDQENDYIYGDIDDSQYWDNVGADIGDVPGLVGEKSHSKKKKRAPRMIYDAVGTENDVLENHKAKNERNSTKNRKAKNGRNSLKKSSSRDIPSSRKTNLDSKRGSNLYKHTDNNHRPARLVDRSDQNRKKTSPQIKQRVNSRVRDLGVKEETERSRPLFGNGLTDGVKTFSQLLAEQKSKRLAREKKSNQRF